MNAKTFLFVKAWMKPLKNLPPEQRWNVIEAIAEYATTGQMTMHLDLMENLAFLFIRNEIDRMNTHRKETCERKRAAAKLRQEKEIQPKEEAEKSLEEDANDANDAKACKPLQADAPFDIISVSESESVSKSESNKKSTTTRVRMRMRGNAESKKPLHHQAHRPAMNTGCLLPIRPRSTISNCSNCF